MARSAGEHSGVGALNERTDPLTSEFDGPSRARAAVARAGVERAQPSTVIPQRQAANRLSVDIALTARKRDLVRFILPSPRAVSTTHLAVRYRPRGERHLGKVPFARFIRRGRSRAPSRTFC